MKRLVCALIFSILSLSVSISMISVASAYVPPPSKFKFQVSSPNKYRHPNIAIISDDNLLADAMAVDFYDKGYNVQDNGKTASLMKSLGITRHDFRDPANLVKLKDTPLDGIILLDTRGDIHGVPVYAEATFVSAYSGNTLAHVYWNNPGRSLRLSHEADQFDRAIIFHAKQRDEWGY